jgi:1,4-alpha-glucan branching enzyme
MHHEYRLGVPRSGVWKEVINTDALCYGGSDVGNHGAVATTPVPWQGHAESVVLSLPPLGVLWLQAGAG